MSDSLEDTELVVVDGREHALMLTVHRDGTARMITQMEPKDTADLLRRLADRYEADRT